MAEDIAKRGLTSGEALEQKKKFGLNKLPEKKARSPVIIFLSQFKNPLIYIISIAAIIALALREWTDAAIILVVIFLDTIVGFFQEYRAEKTMVALRTLLREKAKVIRDGIQVEVDTAEIVPDDIVAVNPGDKIAADGVLVHAVSVTVNEAILTGESEAVGKEFNDPVFMGTIALSGRGLMKVTATGQKTELGKIAGSLAKIKEEKTPLQRRLEKFGQTLSYIVVIICVFIFTIGMILQAASGIEMLKLSIVLAIAAVPEGLLIAVTMILVIGMRAILRRKGLVKKLLAVETLGSVTVICTDKTGTLTEGIMRVAKTDFQSEKMALQIMALCNNLEDSLESALWNYVKSKEMDPQQLQDNTKRIFEIPFSSETKYMVTKNIVNGKEVVHLKGAPDIVLEFCKISSDKKEKLNSQFEEWASNGLKILGLAYKTEGDLREIAGFNWAGLIGIEDPVRPTVKDAIALCKKAGIEIKMITGDYRKTAEKIASIINLDAHPNQILEGKDIDTLSDLELSKVIEDTVIFCRVQPHHKLRIVNALQNWREITAMIGDGVNDAPALKKANIGVSVGGGTSVAQETASLILLDNNFKTLVDAVEEGRIIFDNIKKVVAYVLSNSFAEILTIFIAFIAGWPTPLTVPQILWIHLICDGPSDIALGFERGEKTIMDEPPARIEENIISKSGKILILSISVTSSLLCLLFFWYFWKIKGDINFAQTVVFAVLASQALFYIFSYRSFRKSIFKSGNFFANKPLIGSVLLGFVMVIMALYVPGLNTTLNLLPLDLEGWGVVLGVSFTMIFIVEFVKYISNHFGKGPIERVVLSIPSIWSLHRVKKQKNAQGKFLELHIGVDPKMMGKGQRFTITNQLKQKLLEYDPKIQDITLHIKAEGNLATKIAQIRLTWILKRIAKKEKANIHNVWAYMLSGNYYVDMHLEMNESLSLAKAHEITSKIEERAKVKIPDMQELTTHIEPLGESDKPIILVKNKRELSSSSSLIEEEILSKITKEILDELEIKGDYHDIAIRLIRNKWLVSMHINLQGKISLKKAHQIITQLETKLQEKIPLNARVVIHSEPIE